MEKRIQKRLMYRGLGPAIELRNVPMIRVRGRWTPDINYDDLAKGYLQALAVKPGRLTGNEVRFIRLTFEMTLAEFGRLLNVSHQAVRKWELEDDRATAMSWTTEKLIRLEVANRVSVSADVFQKVYRSLESVHDKQRGVVAYDARRGGFGTSIPA